MRIKTSKLKKLEKNRKSILIDNMEYCYICGRLTTDIHEIYGGRNRKVSMIHGFTIPLCRDCHIFVTNSPEMSEKLKQNCQKAYESKYSREAFLEIIGKNYL